MKILLADDHRLFLDGLKHLVNNLYLNAHLVEVVNGLDALTLIREEQTFDLALIDLRLPGMNGFTLLKALAELACFVPILIISSSEDPEDIDRAFSLGASGFVSKSFTAHELEEAISSILSGGTYRHDKREKTDAISSWAQQHRITPRQLEVLRLAKKGGHNIEIAERLFISERTVKAHIAALFECFNAKSRSELIYKAGQLGLD